MFVIIVGVLIKIRIPTEQGFELRRLHKLLVFEKKKNFYEDDIINL